MFGNDIYQPYYVALEKGEFKRKGCYSKDNIATEKMLQGVTKT